MYVNNIGISKNDDNDLLYYQNKNFLNTHIAWYIRSLFGLGAFTLQLSFDVDNITRSDLCLLQTWELKGNVLSSDTDCNLGQASLILLTLKYIIIIIVKFDYGTIQ